MQKQGLLSDSFFNFSNRREAGYQLCENFSSCWLGRWGNRLPFKVLRSFFRHAFF